MGGLTFQDDINPEDKYLTIEALEDGLTAAISLMSVAGSSIEYCVDLDQDWKSISSGVYTESINAGQSLYFRGNLKGSNHGKEKGCGTFTITKKCNLKGNCMSILFGDDAMYHKSLSGTWSAFFKLFQNCTTIISVSQNFLPATRVDSYAYEYMFDGCSNLINTPNLPASLSTFGGDLECYASMFRNCTSLTTACALPSLGTSYCSYVSMFEGCTSLVNAPEILPATDCGDGCYNSMFKNCTSLVTAPQIAATDLSDGCRMASMFEGCTSLVNAPALPAMKAPQSCYSGMFQGCTSLTTAPELPATEGGQSCYSEMFSGCTSLKKAPQINLETLTGGGYNSGHCCKMFYGCTALETAPDILPAMQLVTNSYYDGCYAAMFMNCTALEYGPNLPATTLSNKCYSSMFEGCTSLKTAPTLPATTLVDGCYTRMFYGCTSLVNAPALPATDLSNVVPESWNYGCYQEMFAKCANLITAPALPAKKLSPYCYRSMFQGCTSLTTAPALPATALENYCYSYMFSGCVSLINVSNELPATKLFDYCYRGMFNGCTSLTKTPNIKATTTAQYCCSEMFENCTNLVEVCKLLPTTLSPYCYYSMFEKCTSLTTAPELPATELANGCYSYMFSYCSSLTKIKMLGIDTTVSECLKGWTQFVQTTGTLVKHINSNVTASQIPSKWDMEVDFTPTKCLSLSIQADDVSATDTTTAIRWIAELQGISGNETVLTTWVGTATSNEFEQNLDVNNSIERVITYTFMGITATTTIIQSAYIPALYSVVLNDDWALSSKNPDVSTYEAFESYSNKGIPSKGAFMSIITDGCSTFNLYIRSYAESNYDYVMVSQLDKSITNDTSYSDSTLIKAHTRGNQKSGTSINDYTLVEFMGIPQGSHTINIVYRKDGSGDSYDDKGYVLINKSNTSHVTGPINTNNYLTIVALEDGLTASLSNNACEYCVDGDGNWKTLAAGTATESINAGHALSFKGNLKSNSSSGIGTFTVNKAFNLVGNCMSMLFSDSGKYARSLVGYYGAFCRLFYNCTSLKEVSENFLPALDTYNYCYQQMFQGCTSLTTAPNIYATNAAYQCCMQMFQGCTRLTKAPVLTATDLGYQYYRNMFNGCVRLVNAPELPATTLGTSCYVSMFYGCTSLEMAPILRASTLTYESYCSMFSGCSKLKHITMLATDISNERCLEGWVNGVASSGTFVKHPNMTTLPTGTSGIPEGWTVVNDGEQSVGNWITFTVNGVEYPAEEGMTWEDWINSSYYDQNLTIVIKTDDSLYIDGDPILRNSLQGAIAQYTNTEIVVNGIYNSM
jgi:hypothetical protein